MLRIHCLARHLTLVDLEVLRWKRRFLNEVLEAGRMERVEVPHLFIIKTRFAKSAHITQLQTRLLALRAV